MAKVKKKLTPAQKHAKKVAKAERQKKYQWVFMHGKQVRISRPPWELMPVEGMVYSRLLLPAFALKYPATV